MLCVVINVSALNVRSQVEAEKRSLLVPLYPMTALSDDRTDAEGQRHAADSVREIHL